jgi:hypothetical protein
MQLSDRSFLPPQLFTTNPRPAEDSEMFRAAIAVGAFVAAGAVCAPAAQSADVAMVLAGLAARTQQYYDRFISIICTETVVQQDLRFNLTPTGKPRVTVYELSVSRDPRAGDNDFRVERALQTVNGRPARKGQEPGCTDPKTGTPEPLGFLLSANQRQFRFALADAAAATGPPGTRAIDFVQTPPDRVTVRWTRDCFEASGGGQTGRVWFDPLTFDVLQVDVRLASPYVVPLPAGHFGLQPTIRVERSEATFRFGRVSFAQPDETVLLPESIDTLNTLRGARSQRTSQTLTSFRRFLAESSIRSSAF